jgi:hypothetical protein
MKCTHLHDSFTHNFLLLITLCLCLTGARGERKCYYPDSTLASSDGDCNPGKENSVCCGKGYVCLGNGICMIDSKTPGVNANLAGTIWRGSCTDQEWKSPDCPKYCAELSGPEAGSLSSGQQLGKCPDMEDTYYCKTSETEVDCNDSSKIFQIRGMWLIWMESCS